MATYQQSITALVDGLKTLFENRTCTEAQALANATSKPNTIYYTSDTHCVVVGGQIYGRGQQLSSVFRFCPSGSVPGQDPDFSDPDYIYVVPDGTSFTLYWLNPGGAWSHTTGFQFDIATSAEDISYDLTSTPDLGEGDVQSAIEALDGKVEAVDARIDDEQVEFIKERFPSETSIPNLYGRSNFNGATFSNTDDNTTWTITAQSNTNYRCFWTKELVPKGTHIIFKMVSTANTNYWRILGYSTDVRPQDYYASHSNTIVGYKVEHKIGATNNKNATYTIEFTMPEDGWLVWTNIGDTDTGETQLHVQLYDPTLLVDLYTGYYKKGVADGSGMASIVGLGYNIFDYITGAVNMDGFEYGVEYRAENPSIVHTSGGKFSDNTSLVYFPKLDVTGMKTNLDNTFFDCTNLVCVPKLTFNGSATTQNMFSGCTKLRAIGELNSLTITTNRYMFANTTSLQRIEGIDITNVVNATNSTTANMFRSSSRTSGCTARYILFKGLGYSSMNTHYFANATYWGVNNADNPDALQSLIDTLYTYSADRSGGTACTIHLSTNSKNALNSATIDGESAISKITAKGYTIA